MPNDRNEVGEMIAKWEYRKNAWGRSYTVFIGDVDITTQSNSDDAEQCANRINAAHKEAVSRAVEEALSKERNGWVCLSCGSEEIQGFVHQTDCGEEHDAACKECGSSDVLPKEDAIDELIGRLEDKEEEMENAKALRSSKSGGKGNE